MQKRTIAVILFFLFTTAGSFSQKSSLIVLGDLHYDLPGDHDMEWLAKKPDDLRQVTTQYTVYTRKYWTEFMEIIRRKSSSVKPGVIGIIQLGDLSEGLAGTPDKARQMAGNVMKAVTGSGMPVPWLLTKGNHDITGPGAIEAYNEYYLPVMRNQTGNPEIKGGNYSYEKNNILIVFADPFDKSVDMTIFLENELSRSKAAIKFVAVHEPVIPVTERCWHLFRNQPEKREKLLEVIAKNKAVVLCAHLHRYSVVRRETKYGPIVQIMVVSVVSDKDYKVPSKIITSYGASIAENVPEWQPETIEQRKKMLEEESRYVTFYKQTDLPGYAVLKIDPRGKSIKSEYFAAYGEKPFDVVNISKLAEE